MATDSKLQSVLAYLEAASRAASGAMSADQVSRIEYAKSAQRAAGAAIEVLEAVVVDAEGGES